MAGVKVFIALAFGGAKSGHDTGGARGAWGIDRGANSAFGLNYETGLIGEWLIDTQKGKQTGRRRLHRYASIRKGSRPRGWPFNSCWKPFAMTIVCGYRRYSFVLVSEKTRCYRAPLPFSTRDPALGR